MEFYGNDDDAGTFSVGVGYNGYFTYRTLRGVERRIDFPGYPSAEDVRRAAMYERMAMDADPEGAALGSLPDTNLPWWHAMILVQVLARVASVTLMRFQDEPPGIRALRLTREQSESEQCDTFTASLQHARFYFPQRLVAIKMAGEIVGLLRYERESPYTCPDREMMIYSLLIDHRFQNRGIGAAAVFLFVCFAFLRHADLRRIELRVTTNNRAAIASYRRAGFATEHIGNDNMHMGMYVERDFVLPRALATDAAARRHCLPFEA